MSEPIEVRLLGRFSVRRAGEEIPPGAFGGRLVRALLRVLLTCRGEFVSHDVLAEALWPERMPADPAANLKVLVNRARTALGDPNLIVTGPRGYSFAGGDAGRVDAEGFLASVAVGRRHQQNSQSAAALRAFCSALEGWGGEPLAEDAYEDWARDYRTALFRAHLEALEGGAAAALAMRDPGQAVVLAEAAVAREPLREAAHLVLAEALAASGDSVAALRTIDGLRRRLGEEVGLQPSAAVFELERRIQRGEWVAPAARRPSGLPAGVTFEGLNFVGRDEQLAAVLAATGSSIPGVVLVQGSAGAGKSRLLAEASARSGVPVLSARAFMPERDEPWALARSLLREALALDLAAAAGLADRAALALADVLPELEEIRSIEAGAIDSESRRALALEGAVRLIGAVAAKGALLVVDDLQWSDPTSLLLLGVVARRVSGAALVFAYRPEEAESGSALAAFLDDLAASRQIIAEIQVGSLPAETIVELVNDAEVAEAIARATDCTPLAVVEVVRRLAAEGMIEPDPRGGWRPRRQEAARLAEEFGRAGQRRSIERRATRQPPGRRETLALLALLGREVPARVLARARDAPQVAILDDLDALARLGLARLGDGGWATAHDLIAETVADTLNREERGRLHHVLASALRACDADPAEVARHLAAAGDRPAAAAAFAEAAGQRLERFAADEAWALADGGLDVEPVPAVRASLLETRAEARLIRGDLVGGRDDLREALAGQREPVDRARLLSKLAVLAANHDPDEAATLAEAALVEAGRDGRSRAEALVAAAFAAGNSDQLDRAERLITEARRLFEELGDTRGLASTVDARANALFFQGRLAEAAATSRRAAQLYRDSGQLLKVGTPTAMRAWSLFLMGRYEQAEIDGNEALDLERALGQPEGEASCLLVGVQIDLGLGRLDRARRRLAAALPICRSVGNREIESWALILSGRLSESAGDLTAAEAAFRQGLEIAGDLPFQSAIAASGLASLFLARGDLDEAEGFARRALIAAVGPGPLEARLLLAEIGLVRGGPGAAATASDALRRAEESEYAPTATRLRLERLLASTPVAAGEAFGRERKVFMFTDIVASSNLVEALGDEAWDHLLRWHDQALRHLFAAHSGEEVNRMGDGFFVAFDRSEAAVDCAVAIQQTLARHRKEHGFAPQVRIGVHEAEATRQGDDYQGKGVHEAARIGALAAGGEILVSRSALIDLEGFGCSEPRTVSLKGFSEPVEVVSVDWR